MSRSFEDVLKTCYFKKYNQLLNSAFRTITRRSIRSKYFLLTDNHRRTRTEHINNRELNKGVYKEFSSLFYIPGNIINNPLITFRLYYLVRYFGIQFDCFTWILFTVYNIIDRKRKRKKKYDLYIYIYPDCYDMQLHNLTLFTAFIFTLSILY